MDLSEIMGQSGVTYHCRCGASTRTREARLAEAPGWSLAFERVVTPARDTKAANGRKKVVPASTRSVPIFLCDTCAKEVRRVALEKRVSRVARHPNGG